MLIETFSKPVRKKDKAKLTELRTVPCLICRKTPSEAHHVTSRGAGGGDVETNLVPLCRYHHALWHAKGVGYMSQTFISVREWIIKNGRQEILKRVV